MKIREDNAIAKAQATLRKALYVHQQDLIPDIQDMSLLQKLDKQSLKNEDQLRQRHHKIEPESCSDSHHRESRLYPFPNHKLGKSFPC